MVFRALLTAGWLLMASGLPRLLAAQPAPTAQWDRTFGGDSNDNLGGVVQTADGGYLLGGTSNSNAVGDKTTPPLRRHDYWVVKLDADGRKLWDRSYGGNADEELTDVCRTPDGGYLLAGTSTSGVSGDKTQPYHGFEPIPLDYWVIKIDAQGNKLWDRTYGGNHDDWLTCARPTPDGGYILGGYSYSGATGTKSEPNRGGNTSWADYWVVKLDANGQKQWDRTFGTAVPDDLTCLLVMPDGGYLLGGYTAGGVSVDKTQPARGADFWLVRLDAQGRKLWDRTIGGLLTDYLRSMALTLDGGLILGGYSFDGVGGDKSEAGRGYYDYWVVKLDAAGQKQWDRTLGSADYDQLNRVCPLADGGYLLAGHSNGRASGDKTQPFHGVAPSRFEGPPHDLWLVKLDAGGQKQWDGVYGGDKNDGLPYALSTADGGFAVGGFSYSDPSGEKTDSCRGNADYWLLKFGSRAAPAAFFVPNIITPNNDARNDQFVIQGVPAGTWVLRVYSRWGQEVFRSTGYQNDWGRAAAPGVYYYLLQPPDGARPLKGWVEVAR
jgi:hypothetical protein